LTIFRGAVADRGRAYERDTAMLALSEYHAPAAIHDRLREAYVVTAELISDVIGQTCRRFPSAGSLRRRRGSSG
jgi:hypothetical protein